MLRIDDLRGGSVYRGNDRCNISRALVNAWDIEGEDGILGDGEGSQGEADEADRGGTHGYAVVVGFGCMCCLDI